MSESSEQQQKRPLTLEDIFDRLVRSQENLDAKFLEQSTRFDLLLGRVASHEEETKDELTKINARVDQIEEGIAASEEVKVVFEERVLKVEEIVRVSSKLAENVAEKNLHLEQIMEEQEQRLEENFRQKFLGAREARSTFTDLERSLEDLRGELAEVKEGFRDREEP